MKRVRRDKEQIVYVDVDTKEIIDTQTRKEI